METPVYSLRHLQYIVEKPKGCFFRYRGENIHVFMAILTTLQRETSVWVFYNMLRENQIQGQVQ